MTSKAIRCSAFPSICLVHTPCLELQDDRLEPPLGLLYLATTVGTLGYPATVVDLSACADADLSRHILDGFNVYGFSTYSVNYSLTCQLMDAVRKRNPQALFLAGGPHATALLEQVAADGFDTVVTGEGEIAIQAIMSAVATGETVPYILPGTPPEPLDALPFPDYTLVNVASYHRQVDGHRCFSILSSRGCPYRCTFCNSNIMGAGHPIRFRSPDNVVAEIRQLKERYGINHFRFQDDVFTINRKHLDVLAPRLAAEHIVYRCFARINNFSAEVARLLMESGCRHVSFGVESGSPKLLGRHAMHKSQTPDQIRIALENAHRAGLRIRIFLIVGFPGESDATIAATLQLVKACPWDEFAVYPLLAYPGTPLHEHPEDFGITYIDQNYSRYLQVGRHRQAGFTIRTVDFDEHRVREWRDRVIRELLADGRTWAGDSPGYQ